MTKHNFVYTSNIQVASVSVPGVTSCFKTGSKPLTITLKQCQQKHRGHSCPQATSQVSLTWFKSVFFSAIGLVNYLFSLQLMSKHFIILLWSFL